MKTLIALLLMSAMPFSLGTAALAGENDIRLSFLLSNCASCHGPEGVAAGAPSLNGESAKLLASKIKAYRDTDHKHIMSAMVRHLSDEEVTQISEYLAQLDEGSALTR